VLWKNRRKVKIAPHWSGKLTTVAQMFALGWVMLRVVDVSPAWPCALAALLTFWSGAEYIRHGYEILRGGPDLNPAP
jgi:CDP-diacylglycerol--glycerol-3-phosphate 3-phosphatidyltransferase/cardiolipin synthase